MPTTTLNSRRLDAAPFRPGQDLPGLLLTVRRTLRRWSGRARGRRELRTWLRLYDTTGGTPPWQDMGVGPSELLNEAAKPFWRA
jgi:uncharacterized protein YjiS (DUF1127 family)